MGLVYGRKSTAKTQDTRTENQFCAQRNSSVRKQKQRCAFQILSQAKQFACLLPMEQKSTPNKWECFLLLNGGPGCVDLGVGGPFAPCAGRPVIYNIKNTCVAGVHLCQRRPTPLFAFYCAFY